VGALAVVSPAPVSAQVMMTSWFMGRFLTGVVVPFAIGNDRER
jgi:hypothetical protein